MKPQPAGHPFTYPLVTIDFEASALTLQSFPIEVGIAIARGSSSEMEIWSSLIRPEVDWTASDE